MPRLYIDFETYSECDLDDCGSYVYANHPSTDVLCLTLKFDEEPTEILKYGEHKLSDRIFSHVAVDGIVVAHNMFFDRNIWNAICHKLYGWPELKLEQCRCTMAKSAAHGFPLKLEKVAVALNLPIGKDTISGRILNKLSKPQKSKKKPDYRCLPDKYPESFETLYKYGIRDTDVCQLIDKTIPDLTEYQLNTWRLNEVINDRGFHVDVPTIKKLLPKIEEEKLRFNSRVDAITNGVITKITQVQRIVKYANEQLVPLANCTKETLTEWVEQRGDSLPADVKEILEMRLMGGKSSTGKYEKMHYFASIDGRVRGTMVYCGAIRTGRFAGRGVQPHNFPKPTVEFDTVDTLVADLINMSCSEVTAKYKSFMHAASTATRPMICAPEGKILYVADYNAIEPRILFWLAGEDDALEVYRQGGDIYIVMAQTVFNNPNLTKKDDKERWVGKQIILGSGYGMGAPKFVVTCASYGREISFKLAEISINSYRNKYWRVVELWNLTEKAAIRAMTTGKIEKFRMLQFKKIGKNLFMKLPSGRKICYPYARLQRVKTPWGQIKLALTYKTVENQMWRRVSTFGGKIIENACQGLACDFMVHGMHFAEAAGYPIVVDIHDEVISETDENFGHIDEYCELLVQKDEWGIECPLAAEGQRVKRYRKL